MRLSIFSILSLILFTVPLTADQIEPIGPPPAVFHPNETSCLNLQLPKVNVISGEYCEEECDLLIAGAEPISFRRFYHHQQYADPVYGRWRINPECLMLFNFEYNNLEKLAGVGERTGGMLLYQNQGSYQLSLDPNKAKGFTNLREGGHPLNKKVSWHKIGGKREFQYTGTIEEGNGGKRLFISENKDWRDQLPIAHPQATIYEERRPNGNILRYTYSDYTQGDKSTLLSLRYCVLNSITAYSGSQELGSVKFHYAKDPKRQNRVLAVIAEGSDGRMAKLSNDIRKVGEEKVKVGNRVWDAITYDTVLDHVDASGKPTQKYTFRWEPRRKYFRAPFIGRITMLECFSHSIAGKSEDELFKYL